MKRDRFFIFIGLGLLFQGMLVMFCQAQEGDNPWQVIVDQEKWDVSAMPEDVDLNYFHDYEQDLLENPVNLGEINPLELLRLGILDKAETDALYQYLLDYGAMVSVYELQMVEGISSEKMAILARYICVRKEKNEIPSLSSIFRSPKIEMLMSGKRTLQTRAGYIKDTSITGLANQYRGNPWQQKLNVRLNFGKNIVIGFNSKNDPGESDLSTLKRVSFDDQSAFFGVNNLGCIKKIVVGRFGVSFGQGLTLGCGSGLGLGKETDLRTQSRGLYPSLSFNRSSSMQGAGIWLKRGPLGLCIFYSSQKLDASVTGNDSISGDPYYTSIIEAGYHRTHTEISKRSRINEKDAGIYLSTGGELWKSGLSVLYHSMDAVQAPAAEPYKYFLQTNNHFWAGWDYVAFFKNLTLFHELSLAGNGKLAGQGGLTFSPSPLIKTSLLFDMVPGFWNNPHGSGGQVSATSSNKYSFASSVYIQMNSHFELQFSSENTRYRWMRYTTTAPSNKIQYHIILKYFPSKTSLVECYYKMVVDQSNVMGRGRIDSITVSRRNSFGISSKFTPDGFLSLKLSAKIVENTFALKGSAMGWLISHDLSCWPVKKKVKLNLHLAFFETDSYNERIYAWEADVYRGFSIPAYYYRGYQYAMVVQFHVNRWIDSWIKYSVFSYPGQVSLGSGSEMIQGDKKSEITCEVRIVLPPHRW